MRAFTTVTVTHRLSLDLQMNYRHINVDANTKASTRSGRQPVGLETMFTFIHQKQISGRGAVGHASDLFLQDTNVLQQQDIGSHSEVIGSYREVIGS